MAPKIICVVISYLLGSIPFGYLFVKYLFTSGEDVRQIGSGGIGATNVTRRAGVKGGERVVVSPPADLMTGKKIRVKGS